MAWAMPPIEPEPCADSTLSGMILAPKATPATPSLLLVAWAMVPATWVPWPWSSRGVGVVGDEVVAGDELDAGQVGHLGDAGVDDRDDHALALAQLPGVGQADLAQVPLVLVAGVVGEARRGRAAGLARRSRPTDGGLGRPGAAPRPPSGRQRRRDVPVDRLDRRVRAQRLRGLPGVSQRCRSGSGTAGRRGCRSLSASSVQGVAARTSVPMSSRKSTSRSKVLASAASVSAKSDTSVVCGGVGRPAVPVGPQTQRRDAQRDHTQDDPGPRDSQPLFRILARSIGLPAPAPGAPGREFPGPLAPIS